MIGHSGSSSGRSSRCRDRDQIATVRCCKRSVLVSGLAAAPLFRVAGPRSSVSQTSGGDSCLPRYSRVDVSAAQVSRGSLRWSHARTGHGARQISSLSSRADPSDLIRRMEPPNTPGRRRGIGSALLDAPCRDAAERVASELAACQLMTSGWRAAGRFFTPFTGSILVLLASRPADCIGDRSPATVAEAARRVAARAGGLDGRARRSPGIELGGPSSGLPVPGTGRRARRPASFGFAVEPSLQAGDRSSCVEHGGEQAPRERAASAWTLMSRTTRALADTIGPSRPVTTEDYFALPLS